MNVQIDPTSWHFKLLKLWNAKHNDNFCTYFWKVLFYVPFTIGAALVLLALGLFMVAALIAPFLYFYLDISIGDLHVLGSTFWFIISIVVLLVIKEENDFDLELGDSLVAQRIKAYKDQVCPRIIIKEKRND